MSENIIIVSGGTLGDSAFFQKELASKRKPLVIACDGGARHLAAMGVRPDVLIGDMDSIDTGQIAEYERQEVRIIRHPANKDFTDTALALEYALDLRPKAVDIWGALGGRIDHALANIHLLMKGWDAGIQTRLIDEYAEVTIAGGETRFLNATGCLVSLIALSMVVEGITLEGFSYPLTNEKLTMSESRGISNIITASPASIYVSSGNLLVIRYWQKGVFPGVIQMTKLFKVLCVGGSDSGAGAGIQADLKAVTTCGCYGTTVITALTAQNTRGVQDVFPVPAKFIAAQMDAVLSDIGANAIKTGMLLTRAAVEAVTEKILQYRIKKVVVDPVMVAKGGRTIMQGRACKAVVQELMPLAYVVTPNIPEAEAITNVKIRSIADMKHAAAVIWKSGVKNVVIKGGHLPGSRKKGSIDILYDGATYFEFVADWIETKNTHGTGCTFASALAAHLACDKDILQSVEQAKRIVTEAIANSLSMGKGHGPVNVPGKMY